jgi:hypothetical protein
VREPTPRQILLGVIDTSESDGAVVLTVPLDADAATIAAAIERAEAERVEAQARESKRLRELFLEDERHE